MFSTIVWLTPQTSVYDCSLTFLSVEFSPSIKKMVLILTVNYGYRLSQVSVTSDIFSFIALQCIYIHCGTQGKRAPLHKSASTPKEYFLTWFPVYNLLQSGTRARTPSRSFQMILDRIFDVKISITGRLYILVIVKTNICRAGWPTYTTLIPGSIKIKLTKF